MLPECRFPQFGSVGSTHQARRGGRRRHLQRGERRRPNSCLRETCNRPIRRRLQQEDRRERSGLPRASREAISIEDLRNAQDVNEAIAVVWQMLQNKEFPSRVVYAT